MEKEKYVDEVKEIIEGDREREEHIYKRGVERQSVRERERSEKRMENMEGVIDLLRESVE